MYKNWLQNWYNNLLINAFIKALSKNKTKKTNTQTKPKANYMFFPSSREHYIFFKWVVKAKDPVKFLWSYIFSHDSFFPLLPWGTVESVQWPIITKTDPNNLVSCQCPLLLLSVMKDTMLPRLILFLQERFGFTFDLLAWTIPITCLQF